MLNRLVGEVMKLFIFISIAFISSVCSEISTLKEDRSQYVYMEKILKTFLVDQESVTVFNVDKSIHLKEYESSEAEVIQRITPVMIYDELWDELAVKISDMGDELNLPSTTKSYFLTTASTALMMKNLPLFAKINTNGKWIFSTINIKQSEVESILVLAWTQHKMANILALTFIDGKMSVVSFNPFELNNNKLGKFWSHEVNSENLSRISEKIENIFDKKVRNLHGYPLKATKFPDISKHNAILDDEMKKVFEFTLKTKLVFAVSRDGVYLGTRLSNGSFTGSIREVEEGLTDIAMNNRLFSPMGSKNCAFLNPTGETDLKYVIKKPPKAPTLLHFHLVQAFDLQSRILYAVTSLTFVIVFVSSSILRRKYVKDTAYDDLSMVILMTLGIQCSISMAKKKSSSHQNILRTSLLVFSLITCNAFTGTIISNLSRPRTSKNTINTLEQLLRSDINLTAIVTLPDLFKPNKDESNVNSIQKSLYKRQTIDNFFSADEADEILLGRTNQAILMREQKILEMMNSVYDNETGDDIFHVVNDSPISFYLTYIVPKSSPFISSLNMAILEAREFGFNKRVWKKYNTFLEISKVKRYRNLILKKKPAEAITIVNIKNIFIFYAICCTASFAMFLAEISCKRVIKNCTIFH